MHAHACVLYCCVTSSSYVRAQGGAGGGGGGAAESVSVNMVRQLLSHTDITPPLILCIAADTFVNRLNEGVPCDGNV